MKFRWKKLLSFVLAIAIVAGLVPTNIFAIKTNAAESDTVVNTDVAWREGANVIEVYNDASEVTKSELYKLFSQKWTTKATSLFGIGVGGYKYNGTQIKGTTELGKAGLTEKTEYTIQYCTKTGYSFSKGETSTWVTAPDVVTVEVYDILTVKTTIDGVTTSNQVKVFRGKSYEVPVSAKDGYIAEVTGASLVNGKYVVSGLSADAEVSVTYVKDTKRTVTLNVNGGNMGTVRMENQAGEEIASGTQLAEGALVKLIVETKASGVTNEKYAATISGVQLNANNEFVVGATDVNITVTFAPESIPVLPSPYVIKINGYSNDTKAVDLKTLVLDAVIGKGNYNAADYRVEMLTEYKLGSWELGEDYYDVTGYDGTLIDIPASWFVTQLAVDGVTENNFKIVKLAASNACGQDLYIENLMIVAEEARKEASVEAPDPLQFTTYDTVDDFLAAIKEATKVYDMNGNQISSEDLELAIDENYVVTWKIEAGETWLAAEGTLGTYIWNISVYEIIFVDEDGSVLYSWNFEFGKLPVYGGKDVEELAASKNNAQYTVTWKGWNPDIDLVNGTATYTATYERVVKEYTITWVNGNETTTTTVKYGELPVAPEAFKSSTVEYHFVNGTWGNLVAVTGEATYTATFEKQLRKYTVTFVDQDDNVLSAEEYDYGTPAVNIVLPEAPTVKGHTFDGWTVSAVNGEVTYKATYTANQYKITWIVNGEVTEEYFTYGEKVNREVPYLDGYGFVGWIDENESIVDLGFEMPDYEIVLTAKFWPAEARIGETLYESFVEAVNEAQPGDVIILMKDITLGEKITIKHDITILGSSAVTLAEGSTGFKITRANDYTGTLFVVNAGATLTLGGNLIIDGGHEYVFD